MEMEELGLEAFSNRKKQCLHQTTSKNVVECAWAGSQGGREGV